MGHTIKLLLLKIPAHSVIVIGSIIIIIIHSKTRWHNVVLVSLLAKLHSSLVGESQGVSAKDHNVCCSVKLEQT